MSSLGPKGQDALARASEAATLRPRGGWRDRWTALRGARRSQREAAPATTVAASTLRTPELDIEPDDPVLAHFQAAGAPVDLDDVDLDTPAVRELRAAGVRLVVPLVAQGELIGLINLGPRLSEQEYTSDDRKLLESLASQAAPALRVAQLVREQEAQAAERERIAQELEVATLIQHNYLPQRLPDPEGWRISAFYRPAREVGGDFYDFVDLGEGRLGIFTGDVTDKGVPAALVMSATRAVLRTAARRSAGPAEVLARVNDEVHPDMPPRMFVTCLYGVLDLTAGVFRFANAGHNLPCVATAAGPVETRATGMPLGLMPGTSYEEAEIRLQPGETLLLYSDALPEAHAPDGHMYGFPRLVRQVGHAPGGARLIEHLLDDLASFTGPQWEQEDDITLVAVERLAAPTAPTAPGVGGGEDSLRRLAVFRVPSVPGGERRALLELDRALADVPLAPSRRERLATAVAEATMNAIEHGNAGRPDLDVELEVLASSAEVVVRISDRGVGGPPPGGIPPPDLDAKLRGEQSPRGWGLFLIRNMVDDVHEYATDDRHTVELVLAQNGAAHDADR